MKKIIKTISGIFLFLVGTICGGFSLFIVAASGSGGPVGSLSSTIPYIIMSMMGAILFFYLGHKVISSKLPSTIDPLKKV